MYGIIKMINAEPHGRTKHFCGIGAPARTGVSRNFRQSHNFIFKIFNNSCICKILTNIICETEKATPHRHQDECGKLRGSMQNVMRLLAGSSVSYFVVLGKTDAKELYRNYEIR